MVCRVCLKLFVTKRGKRVKSWNVEVIVKGASAGIQFPDHLSENRDNLTERVK